MGVVVPVGFAQVNAVFKLTGDVEDMVVTLGIDPGAISVPTVLADLVWDELVNAGTIFAASSFSANYQIGPFTATIMTATGPQTGEGTSSRDGTNAGVSALPNNVAVLVQKRTARGGRQGRGRSYFPCVFPTEGDIGPTGDMSTTSQTAWQTAMNEFLSGLAAADIPMVLLHSEAAGGLAPDPVTALVVDQKVATQRTRLRR